MILLLFGPRGGGGDFPGTSAEAPVLSLCVGAGAPPDNVSAGNRVFFCPAFAGLAGVPKPERKEDAPLGPVSASKRRACEATEKGTYEVGMNGDARGLKAGDGAGAGDDYLAWLRQQQDLLSRAATSLEPASVCGCLQDLDVAGLARYLAEAESQWISALERQVVAVGVALTLQRRPGASDMERMFHSLDAAAQREVLAAYLTPAACCLCRERAASLQARIRAGAFAALSRSLADEPVVGTALGSIADVDDVLQAVD